MWFTRTKTNQRNQGSPHHKECVQQGWMHMPVLCVLQWQESSLPKANRVYPGTAEVNLKAKGWHTGVVLCSVTSEGKCQSFISSLEACEPDTWSMACASPAWASPAPQRCSDLAVAFAEIRAHAQNCRLGVCMQRKCSKADQRSYRRAKERISKRIGTVKCDLGEASD